MSDEEPFSSMDKEATRQLMENIAEVAKRRPSIARHNPGNPKAALVELNQDKHKDTKPFEANNAKPLEASRTTQTARWIGILSSGEAADPQKNAPKSFGGKNSQA